MANVYDHIQEREARKDRTAALTKRPEPDHQRRHGGGDAFKDL